MDYRTVKRQVCLNVSRQLAEDAGYVEDSKELSPQEKVQYKRALEELADELRRRATGERKPPPAPVICTDQMALWSAVQ